MNLLRRIVLATLAVFLGACSEDGRISRGPAAITLFQATPSTIAPGRTTTLEWASVRASECTASGDLPGWTGSVPTSGTLPIVVASAGVYEATLSCADIDGRGESKSVIVTVSDDLVRIDSFTATPATVAVGNETTLAWTSSNASTCRAEGSLPGWSGGKSLSGSLPITPAVAGSYEATLVCEDDAGESDTRTVAVTVTEIAGGVSIVTFTAVPSELPAGGSTQLGWASTGATGCTAGGTLPGWSGAQDVTGVRLVTLVEDGSYTAELTCTDGTDDVTASLTVKATPPKRHRYAMANGCFAIKSAANGMYVVPAGSGYAATAAARTAAEPFYLKASALGDYMLYNSSQQLVSAGIGPTNPLGATCAPPSTSLCNVSLPNAIDASIFDVRGADDSTEYPVPPQYDTATTPAEVAAYRNFVDPQTPYALFKFSAKPPDGRVLTAAANGTLSMAAAAAEPDPGQQFILYPSPQACAPFPEAQNNAVGNTFKGTTADGRVVGFADTHVHVTSTTFLGGAKAGAPFHKFGATHAVGDCAATHGPQGSNDFLMAAYAGDNDGHATDGWPTFTDWPSRDALSDEAMYWKWIERTWLGGQRVLVNDLVDNGTLCELQRNAVGPGDPRSTSEDCNEMKTAREQVGTTYAMEDYIDAQYGGRGKGFWRVVWSPEEARQVIADGKMAVIIGIELTNMFDCQLVYNPLRQTEPFEEPMDAAPGGTENVYKCAATETGAPNEIKTQLDEMYDLGLRQIISIHEFDIAFGGNGIFNAVVLNLGNRENSGGNPTPGVPPNNPFDQADPKEVPTGEFWTTYDCPADPGLWGGIGQVMNESQPFVDGGYPEGWPFPSGCAPPPDGPYQGQGGRPGGPSSCYPAGVPQCNARLMTPIGLYLYKLLMEKGLIIDFDHMAFEMKNQILTLSELQNQPYPTISTHGTFGGTSLEQGRRVLKNGGHLYPSIGRSHGFIADMIETKGLWNEAATQASPWRTDLFAFGFGTDTNGLSGQSSPRASGSIAADGPVVYPFTYFTGPIFDAIPEFATLDDDGNSATPYQGVTFYQPEEFDLAGNSARTWHVDVDGTAHAGMVTDTLYEMQLEAIASAARDSQPLALHVDHIRDLFNSAEVFIQTWERTLASQAAIVGPDGTGKAAGTAEQVLYEAPGKRGLPFP